MLYSRPFFSLCSAAALLSAPHLSLGEAAAPAPFKEPKGGEFKDFGIPVEVATHRGAIIVEGKEGHRKFLMNLNDWTGGYGLILVDPESGKSDFFPFPFRTSGSQFASLYSSKGLFYNQFGNHFCEFDPRTETFTFLTKTKDNMAMMMTEDDHGVIWMATYPKAHLMSFDPATQEFTEYGAINEENWPQYPRSIAVDDTGWVYIGISFTKGQIVAFNPLTRETRKLVPEEERAQGPFDIRSPFHTRNTQGTVWRAKDGYVYARLPNSPSRPWFKLREGNVERVESVDAVEPKLEVAGSQFLFQGKLPDGREITDLDVPKKTYRLVDREGQGKQVRFDYPSSGARISSIGLGPDGRVYGSTGHPLQFFALDPKSGTYELAPEAEGGHINAITSVGSFIYGAIYTQGVLVRHDTSTTPLNFERLTQAGETVLRPFGLIGINDGAQLAMIGSPGYGRTGGGMFFYSPATGDSTTLQHDEIVPHQSTKALIELPDGNLLGATTIEAGTGGQPLAREAVLYIMKMPEKKVIFHEALIPNTPQYRDLLLGENGLVYGLAGTHGYQKGADFHIGGDPTFFVFDPEKRKIVHQENLRKPYGALTGGQAPRVMAKGPDGQIYILFAKCIARVDPKTFAHAKVADSPVPIHTGVAFSGDTLYFSSGGSLWGYRIQP